MGSTNNRPRKKIKEMKTFTYFIPAPPQRKTGYREKEFDKIIYGILQSGFELMELKTQASENGIFVILILSAPNKKIAKLDEFLDLHEKFKLQDKHSSPEIELDDEDV
jgi:hypothetical protein